MLKFAFELLTEPLGLPIHWIYEYFILAVIGMLAYKFAFKQVGDLYNSGIINGRFLGSIFHWVIRLIVFSLLWAITYGLIWLGKIVLGLF